MGPADVAVQHGISAEARHAHTACAAHSGVPLLEPCTLSHKGTTLSGYEQTSLNPKVHAHPQTPHKMGHSL